MTIVKRKKLAFVVASVLLYASINTEKKIKYYVLEIRSVRSIHSCVFAFVRVANRTFSMWCHMWCKCRMYSHSHSVLCAVECAFRQNYTNPIFTIICVICLSSMVALLHFLWEAKRAFHFRSIRTHFWRLHFSYDVESFYLHISRILIPHSQLSCCVLHLRLFFSTHILIFFLSQLYLWASFSPCPFVHNNFGIFMANDFLNRMQCTKEENEHRMKRKKNI